MEPFCVDIIAYLCYNYNIVNDVGFDIMIETLTVVVKKMYRAWKASDGWFPCLVRDNKTGDTFHLSGKSDVCIEVGMRLNVVGSFEQSNYGRQFVCSHVAVEPISKKSIINYLASRRFKGIGVKTAKELYDAFGTDVISKIRDDIDCVKRTCCLSEKQCRVLTEGVNQYDVSNVLFQKLPALSQNVVTRMYEKYGDSAFDAIRNNPYVLVSAGMSFATCDRLAREYFNIGKYDIRRVAFGVHSVFDDVVDVSNYLNLSDGNLYQLFIQKVNEKLATNFDTKNIVQYLQSISSVCIVQEYNEYHMYEDKFYRAQQGFVTLLEQKRNLSIEVDVDEILDCIELWEYEANTDLSDEQHSAVIMALSNGISMITGGPGRGKTAVVDCICYVYEHLNKKRDVCLLAPTGRAANRLREVTRHPAFTVAKFLTMISNKDDAYGLFIVDESSMLGLVDCYDLLMASEYSCGIVFVGDVNQLPPIERGFVFNDMLSSGKIPATRLLRNFRVKIKSIADNADKVIMGDNSLEASRHFVMDYDCNNLDEKIFNCYKDSCHLYGDKNVTLVTPVRNGELGVNALNIFIRDRVNPKKASFDDALKAINRSAGYGASIDTIGTELDSPVYRVSGNLIHFRIGDRVMQTKNNYNLDWVRYHESAFALEKGCGIFNGDCGIIKSYVDASFESSACVVVEFDDGRVCEIPVNDFADFRHAYAVTVHKVQGCEYKCVIYVLPPDLYYLLQGHPEFLCRNLTYTAITRAKQIVYVFGDSAMMNRSILTKMKPRDSVVTQLIHDKVSN